MQMLAANLAPNTYATRFKTEVNEDDMVKYERTLETVYTAGADGEVLVVIDAPGALRITQVERNTQPMDPSEYGFNANSLQLSLVNPLGAGEKLYILYPILITS